MSNQERDDYREPEPAPQPIAPSTLSIEQAGKIYMIVGVLFCLGGINCLAKNVPKNADSGCGFIVMMVCVVVIGTWLGLLGRRLKQHKIEDPAWVAIVTLPFGLIGAGLIGLISSLGSIRIPNEETESLIILGGVLISVCLLVSASGLIAEGRGAYLVWRQTQQKLIVRRNPFE